MDDEGVARAVAAELAPQFGPSLVEKLDESLRNPGPVKRQATRSLSAQALHAMADVVVIATFIITMVPIIRAKAAQFKDDKAATAASTQEAKQHAPHVPPDVVVKVVAAVLEQIHRHQEPKG